jgi:hypothetical protein
MPKSLVKNDSVTLDSLKSDDGESLVKNASVEVHVTKSCSVLFVLPSKTSSVKLLKLDKLCSV